MRALQLGTERFGQICLEAEGCEIKSEMALVEDAKQLQKLVAPSGPRKPAPVPEAVSGSSPKVSKGELFENAWRGAFG